jgi:uncharacterized protein (TIGR03437 family)
MHTGLRRITVFSSPLWLFTATLLAQHDRVAARIDQSRTVVLQGQTHSRARPQFDQGRVEPTFELPSLMMHLKTSTEQQAELQQLLAAQQDPSSPDFHKWLTPEQFADRFGVSQNDIDKITAWIQSQGLTVKQVARSRSWIIFGGTAEQAQAAFRTEIHRYNANGVSFYSNSTDPSIPAGLAGIVSGVRGLNNIHLKPRYVKGGDPKMTLANGSHRIAPDDLATIYNIAPLYRAGIDGTGQTIAVVGQTAINLSDLRTFRSRFNLPAQTVQQVLVPGHPDPGISDADLGEADLDIEWAGAVARNATIVYVYSDDVLASLYHAVDQNLASVVTMSYGACEGSDLIDLPPMQAAAQHANAQGMTWLAASGDSGAADCEDIGAAVAQNGLAVDAPSSIPEVTGMGGTTLNEQGGSYWNSTNDANSASALSYIPEKVWNDTSIDGMLSASGGGMSIFFPRPAWQTGSGVPADAFRHVPDLALSSSVDHDGYYVFSGGSSAYYGGTSVAAPSMAGIVALLSQYLVSTGSQKKPGVGNINPTLYRLAQSNPSAFHDVTVGDNMVPCASGSVACTNGQYGHTSGPGYDNATGLGSPDAFNLVHAWSSSPAINSAVVPSIDQNPVFQKNAPVNGNSWAFTITLTEEAGVGTTLTAFNIDGKATDIAAAFGAVAIPPNGSLSSKNLGFASLAVPKSVLFEFSGVDASGRQWSQQFSVPFNGVQIPLAVGGVSNAASGQQTYAPGEIVSVYGTQLGNFPQSAAAIPLPNYLAGFEASVDGVPAPLYYVSPGQVNIQIPYETLPGRSTLMVGNPFINVNYSIQITSAAPGIFTSNGAVSAPFSSARRGQTTTLFITGDGQVRPTLATGTTPSPGTSTSRLPKPVLAVTMTVGAQPAAIAFYGIPSGLVGVTQINFVVPQTAPLGVQPVIVTVGNVASPPVNLTVTQ